MPFVIRKPRRLDNLRSSLDYIREHYDEGGTIGHAWATLEAALAWELGYCGTRCAELDGAVPRSPWDDVLDADAPSCSAATPAPRGGKGGE